MPLTEAPPTLNTTGVPPPPKPEQAAAPVHTLTPVSQPAKLLMTQRFGEVDHTELVKMLDSLADDRSKSRFRESIYLSIIFYLAVAWLLVYGPRVLFHPGKVVDNASVTREKERLSQLSLDNEMAKLKKPPPLHPQLDRKAMEQLQAMRRAQEAARPPAPAAPAPQASPKPAPAATQPPAPIQPPPPPLTAQVTPLPQPPAPQPAPQPRPAPPSSSVPDAPKPNFNTPQQTPGQQIASAAAGSRGSGRSEPGFGSKIGKQGAAAGYEILSDTQGVDFSDYIKRLLRLVRGQWEPLIPEECYPPLNKEGMTLVRFVLAPNGVVLHMYLDDSTHDRAIDKAAWGSINAVGQFPPLPSAFKGPNLELRIQFVISRNAVDTN